MEHHASLEDIEYFLLKYAKNKNIKLLDIGCADGEKVANLLNKEYFKDVFYFGLDSVYWDDKNIKVTSGKNKNFIYGDVCNLPFSENEFDLIILSHTLEHISDAKRSLFEINRVIKPDGKILIIVPLEGNNIVGFINRYRFPWKNFRKLLNQLGIFPYYLSSPHVIFKTYEQWKSLIENKFNIVESYTRGSLIMLAVLIFHYNVSLISRHKFNALQIFQRYFPMNFKNSYRKSKYIGIDATFIVSAKNNFKN